MSCVLNVLERVFGSRPSGRLASQYAGPGKRKARHHSSSIQGGLHCLRKTTREETKLIPRGHALFARGGPTLAPLSVPANSALYLRRAVSRKGVTQLVQKRPSGKPMR